MYLFELILMQSYDKNILVVLPSLKIELLHYRMDRIPYLYPLFICLASHKVLSLDPVGYLSSTSTPTNDSPP